MQIKTFEWEATDKRNRVIKGKAFDVSETAVTSELKAQGLAIKKIKEKKESFLDNKKVTKKDIMMVTRQISTMLLSGLSIVESLEVATKNQEKKSMCELLLTIKSDIAGGDSFASALEKHPEQFDKLYCALVEAGEQSGSLDTMLERIATNLEKSYFIKSKIKRALTYPVAVISISLLLGALLLIYVVPQFEVMFASYGAELPLFTQGVIAASEFLQAWWYIILILIIASIWGIKYALKTSKKFRYEFDKRLVHIWLFGPMIQMSILARVTRTLATSISAGVPIVDSIQQIARTAGNELYNEAFSQVKEDLSVGQELNIALNVTRAFPQLLVQMVRIGEKSGQLVQMLNKSADFYEKELDDQVEGVSSLFEPIIMLVLGGMIGGFVIAMYLPIFQLGGLV